MYAEKIGSRFVDVERVVEEFSGPRFRKPNCGSAITGCDYVYEWNVGYNRHLELDHAIHFKRDGLA
jgi:hypothetical protein